MKYVKNSKTFCYIKLTKFQVYPIILLPSGIFPRCYKKLIPLIFVITIAVIVWDSKWPSKVLSRNSAGANIQGLHTTSKQKYKNEWLVILISHFSFYVSFDSHFSLFGLKRYISSNFIDIISSFFSYTVGHGKFETVYNGILP